MADIIDIAGHTPAAEPEVVAEFRVLLSEAMTGMITSFVAIRVDDMGKLHANYFMGSQVAELALNSLIHRDDVEKYVD